MLSVNDIECLPFVISINPNLSVRCLRMIDSLRVSEVVPGKPASGIRRRQGMKQRSADQGRNRDEDGELEADIIAVRSQVRKAEECTELDDSGRARADDSCVDSAEAEAFDNLA